MTQDQHEKFIQEQSKCKDCSCSKHQLDTRLIISLMSEIRDLKKRLQTYFNKNENA